MSTNRAQLSQQARVALSRGDVAAAQGIARNLLAATPLYADGHYLMARVALAQRQVAAAQRAYQECLKLDAQRMDAVTELADLWLKLGEHGRSFNLLKANFDALRTTSGAAFAAAELLSRLAMHERAFTLYQRANELQPNVPRIEAGLAASATKNGEISQAEALYEKLLAANPAHQRNHYELSRLRRATSRAHVNTMLEQLNRAQEPRKGGAETENHIFMHFAIAKELEDLEDWPSSFSHYAKGAELAAVECAKAGYSVAEDLAALEACQTVYTQDWLEDGADPQPNAMPQAAGTPIFVVGLPRTGTTLVERILASHSAISSADETFFMQAGVAKLSNTLGQPLAATLRAATQIPSADLAAHYLQAVAYRVPDSPFFVDKYPFNFYYLGLIARAMPHAKIVLLERDPMDACVAMFKQPYFKFSFRLDDLADYYLAYRRLVTYWQTLIPTIHVVKYEDLISNTNDEIDRLLHFVGVDVEPECYRFYAARGASASASSVQVREKVHSRSVGKWRHWRNELSVLAERLNG